MCNNYPALVIVNNIGFVDRIETAPVHTENNGHVTVVCGTCAVCCCVTPEIDITNSLLYNANDRQAPTLIPILVYMHT